MDTLVTKCPNYQSVFTIRKPACTGTNSIPACSNSLRFNFAVPLVQQAEFPLYAVLFRYRAWLVSHNLRNNSGRDFNPLGQRAEGAAQTMQGQHIANRAHLSVVLFEFVMCLNQ